MLAEEIMINCKKLRIARIIKEFTQTQVAKAIGVTQSHYNKIEKGKRVGSIKTIQAICKVLNISISEILEP